VVEVRWTSDEAVDLHPHNYYINLRLEPGQPAAMVIEAYATGRSRSPATAGEKVAMAMSR
jgi:hypothetical protein